MPLSSRSHFNNFDDTPPPIFRQGASALSKLIFFCALAFFLMIVDVRFGMVKPFRSALATAVYPFQWLALQPFAASQAVSQYFQRLSAAQDEVQRVHLKLTAQMHKADLVEQLQIENHRLRELLQLRQRPQTQGTAAQVIYDAADPYTRKIVIDKGESHQIVAGSPVLDEFGVVGQVTRVHPLTSEVTLLIDRDQAIPVLNVRTGARSVAYGDPLSQGGTLELRFMAATADVLQGDLLTTSGVDGVYPAGLPVAKVDKIERRADTAFAKIHCQPVAKTSATTHVMVLAPLQPPQANSLPAKTAPSSPSAAQKQRGKP